MMSFIWIQYTVNGNLLSVTSNDGLRTLMHSLVTCHRIWTISRRFFFFFSKNFPFLLLLDSNGPINPQLRIKCFSQKANFHFFLLSALQLHNMKTLKTKQTAKKRWTFERRRAKRIGANEQILGQIKFSQKPFFLFYFLFGFSFCLVHHSHIPSIHWK